MTTTTDPQHLELTEADWRLIHDPANRKTLEEVAESLGQKPASVRRWAREGVAGHVLRTVNVGVTKYTCDAYLREFFAAIRNY